MNIPTAGDGSGDILFHRKALSVHTVLMSIVFWSLRFLSVTFSVMMPGVFVLRTTTTSRPANSFICVPLNGSSDVASPLQAA